MLEKDVTTFSEKLAAYLFCQIILNTSDKETRERICKYWNDDHKERRKGESVIYGRY